MSTTETAQVDARGRPAGRSVTKTITQAEAAPPTQPTPPMSVVEARAQKPRQRRRTRSAPLRPMSDKQRAWNMSPKNLERLRGNLQASKAQGRQPTRRGVPDGWGGKGRRKRLAEVRTLGEQRADHAMQRLWDGGLLDAIPGQHPIGNDGTVNEQAAANAALRWALSVVLAVDPEDGKAAYTVRARLKAARLVLAYTMPLPMKVSRKEGATAGAERLLFSVLANNE